MIKKRYYVAGALIILFFLGAGPIIINKLMFEQDWAKVNGNEALWIPSLATYFGAIVGGIISGGLTLAGVYLGFKLEREKSLVERYHSVSSDLIDFEDWLESNSDMIKYLMNGNMEIENSEIKEIKTKGRKYEILVAKLDNELFSLLKEFNYNLAWFYLNLEMSKSPGDISEDYIQQLIKNDVTEVEKCREKIKKRINFIKETANF